MINPDAPTTELLPGFTRADMEYLAECLEGRHGEGRRAEAAPRSAAFIRAALVRAGLLAMKKPGYGMPGLQIGPRALTDNDLEAAMTPLTAHGAGGEVLVLSESERRMIEKQRAHEARNRSNEEDGNGGLPPA